MPPKKPSHEHLSQLDKTYCWHPFTQMKDWIEQDPIIITSGKGSVLKDTRNRRYLDANSSIWTNLHGHRHPVLDSALRDQLKRIAHSSYLGLANEPASLLAEKLTAMANPETVSAGPGLEKVFYSDDGSTAVEVALKLVHGHAKRELGIRKPRFASMADAYHGDTVGAASLGQIGLFRREFKSLQFPSAKIPSPYCYRCPHNRARPERADARQYRRCSWECLEPVATLFRRSKQRGQPISALMVEPLMQGAAGMIPQPEGWLKQVAQICAENQVQLIADEVMTAFGRVSEPRPYGQGKNLSTGLLACHEEGVQPAMAAVAKGLSGGYLPFAATLVCKEIFNAFLGRYDEFKSFFHGHSYTANALGAAVSLANLGLLETRKCLRARTEIALALETGLSQLWDLPNVGDIRRCGTVAGVELVRDFRSRDPFAPGEQAGIRVCRAMAASGVLTRPIGNVIVIMPPYSTTRNQVYQMISVLHRAIQQVLGK